MRGRSSSFTSRWSVSENDDCERPPATACLLGHGVDYWQQSYDLEFPHSLYIDLERYKRLAAELNSESDGQVLFTVDHPAEMHFAVSPRGHTGGIMYVLSNKSFVIMLRARGLRWGVTGRINADALWAEGHVAARRHLTMILEGLSSSKITLSAPPSVTRVDYAYDFSCPTFSQEMNVDIVKRLVLTRPAKMQGNTELELFGAPNRLETLTIGRLPGRQLQLYDKALQIRKFNKDWHLYRWDKCSDWCPTDPIVDIWRLEGRLGSDALRKLPSRVPEYVDDALAILIPDLLRNRRLVAANGDKRLRRRPIHWMWGQALANPPRAVGWAPHEIPQTAIDDGRYERLIRQMMGEAISAATLHGGAVDATSLDAVLRDIQNGIAALPPPRFAAMERRAKAKNAWR